jgi:hypothetical protein
MKKSLLLLPLTLTLVAVQAQKKSSVYEVIDPVKGGFSWTAIRELPENGEGDFIIDNKTAAGTVIDAKLQIKKTSFSFGSGKYFDQPLYSGVAALAFDKEHNRLYFSTMFTQQFRYIVLGKNQSAQYYQAAALSDVLRSRGNSYIVGPADQSAVITRMTIGADGYGYGISNDGLSFFRFSLDKKTEITELGGLVDDVSNGAMSVHNQCTSWGGDVVAAADGSLYLFTMRQLVYKIAPATRIATYVGKLKGLDDKFTVNGAAVDDDGKVLLSTAAYTGSRGLVQDMTTLSTIELKNPSFGNASDLASGNVLFANPSKKVQPALLDKLVVNKNISVYPNPVTNGFTLLQFDRQVAGRVTIDILNGAGTNVQRKSVSLNAEGQQVRLNTATLAKGLYVVKVTDAASKEVYSSKLIIQ